MYIKSVLFFTIALIISSCGNDDTTTNTPANNVLYSLDSISVWLTPGSGSSFSSQVFQQTTTASRVKVEYTVQTNVDSLHSMAWVKDSSNGSLPHVVEQQYYWSVDSAVSYVMDIPAQPIYLRLEARLSVYGSSIPYYMRLKNIKVTKQ